MKLISYSFHKGGAAIAAKKFGDIAESILYRKVETLSVKPGFSMHFLKRLVSFLLVKFQRDNNPIKHSLNLFSYHPVINEFQGNQSELHHIHWINNDTLSIFDFDKIPSGTIITLHDEWLYCGAEHIYKLNDDSLMFMSGYQSQKESLWGINWNYIIWQIKFKKLANRKDLIFTVPSSWLLDRASKSLILKSADIRLLPNPIDTTIFKPLQEKQLVQCKSSLGLNSDSIIISFATFSGKNNELKGNAILNEALQKLNKTLPESISKRITLVIFGGKKVPFSMVSSFRAVEVGRISEPSQLAQIYSISNCVVVPSLVESFGQVAAEAASSGTPVICFDTSGLRDIVIDGKTGFLAEPFNAESLSSKLLKSVMMNKQDLVEMRGNARKHIMTHFSYHKVAEKYAEVIHDAEKIKAHNIK